MRLLALVSLLFLMACSGSTSGFVNVDEWSSLPVDMGMEKRKENFPWNGKYVWRVENQYVVSESVEVIGWYEEKKSFKVLDTTSYRCGKRRHECWVVRPSWRVRFAKELLSERLRLFFRLKLVN